MLFWDESYITDLKFERKEESSSVKFIAKWKCESLALTASDKEKGMEFVRITEGCSMSGRIGKRCMYSMNDTIQESAVKWEVHVRRKGKKELLRK